MLDLRIGGGEPSAGLRRGCGWGSSPRMSSQWVFGCAASGCPRGFGSFGTFGTPRRAPGAHLDLRHHGLPRSVGLP
ncbi:MAG: hypothetical protein ACK559_26845 [bacterium]